MNNSYRKPLSMAVEEGKVTETKTVDTKKKGFLRNPWVLGSLVLATAGIAYYFTKDSSNSKK